VNPLQVRLRDVLVVFDGTVLEVFDGGTIGSARHHVALIAGLSIDRNFLKMICDDSSVLMWIFEDAQRADVQALVDAVAAARAA
jgi:hypothetical protein